MKFDSIMYKREYCILYSLNMLLERMFNMKELNLRNIKIKKSTACVSAICVFLTVFVIFAFFNSIVGKAQENSKISVENTDIYMTGTLPINVYAEAIGSKKCFVLTLSSVGAGLSEEYVFDENNMTKIIDKNGKSVTLNRNIGGDGAVNYWFNLDEGEIREFSLNCVSGTYVVTENEINEYQPEIMFDENNKETVLTKNEIIENIKLSKQAENSNAEKIKMTVFFGVGDSFKTAMENSADSETLSLCWNSPDSKKSGLKKLRLMSGFTSTEKYIDGGQLTDTASWKYTKNTLTNETTLTVFGTGPMPDYNYSESPNTPWNQNGIKSATRVVIEDGITAIGNNTFRMFKCGSVSIGKDVETIGDWAINGTNIKSIVIPGNVKNIKNYALGRNFNLESVTLSEGIENFGDRVFMNDSKITKLKLPSTVKTFNASETAILKEISIGDNNDNGKFFVKDNVLFERLDNEKTKLVWYPAQKEGEEYTIPSFVTDINSNYAFSYTKYLKTVTIPGTVTDKITPQFFFYGSNVENVTVEKGAAISSTQFFSYATNLRNLKLDETSVAGNYFYFQGSNKLEEAYIPKLVTGMVDRGLGEWTPNLEKVYFDAADCKGFQVWSRANKYELIIGKNVNNLYGKDASWNYNGHGFQMVLASAGDVKFDGPNQITIAENVFEDRAEPLKNLSGSTVWTDEQGVVYKYDKTSETASVAYVPYGVTNITVPKTITPETGVTCTVNKVEKYSFRLARDLTSVTFDAPEVIETIESYGFANCSKLSSVNGQTSEKSAAASFTNAKTGYHAFINTNLTSESGKVSYDESMNGKKIINLDNFILNISIDIDSESQNPIGQWIGNDEKGGYKFLTNQVEKIHIQMSGSDTENIYRVYFEFSDPDGALSISPGQSLIYKEAIKAVCHATDIPNVCYVDFTRIAGATADAVFNASYASPTSPGGELKIWGMKLTPDEAAAQEGKIIECVETQDSSDSIQSYWTTCPDEFIANISKSGNPPTISLIGDGKGNIIPENDISWVVNFTRTSTATESEGKDFVTAVDFYNYAVLPEHITWNPDVVAAVKQQNIRISGREIYFGDTKIASIDKGYSFGVTWDDEKNTLLFHWKQYNSSTTSEIGVQDTNITICKDAVSTDSSLATAPLSTEYTMNNYIYSVVHYTYSKDKQTDLKQAACKFVLKPATLTFGKKTTTVPTYFGEDITYTLSLKNTGSAVCVATESGSYRINDPLEKRLYIKPENIEKMLKDSFGKKLTVTVNNARFTENKYNVTDVDGTTACKTAANSDINYTEDNITIAWNGNAIQVTMSDGTVHTVTGTLKELFDELGFCVAEPTQYTVNWTLNDSSEKFTLNGGVSDDYIIYATVKDTFQLLKTDNPTDYSNTKYIDISNMAYLYDYKNTVSTNSRTGNRVNLEAIISKSVYKHDNSEPLSNNFNAAVNDVLDNYISFSHYGNSEYDNLPMVDDISGTQTLLVPVAENTALDSMGLKKFTVTQDGKDVEYYKLNKENTYKNVVVGTDINGKKLTADTITVSKTADGLNTQVKWYYSHLNGGGYLLEVCYYTLVDFDVMTSTNYNICNKAWMNDRQSDRIYADIFGSGSLIDFKKEIVYKNQDGTYTADDDDYSAVAKGEKVTYRLTLSNSNEFDINLKGTDITDRLPVNAKLFNWEKGSNVNLYWQETDGVTVSKLDDWTIERDNNEAEYTGSYYMKWSSDTSISIGRGKTFYMYVTLDFPDDYNIWKKYCKYVNGDKIYNVFKVYDYPDEVSHSLKGLSEAVLQKGVYSTLKYYGSTFTETASRIYYNNRDYTNRAIMYYVTLYNKGDNRLYLTDMQDRLPDGFEFLTLRNSSNPSGNFTNTLQTLGGMSSSLVDIKNTSGDDIKYRIVNVSCEKSENNILTFKFSRGSQSADAIKYDEKEHKPYLESGEAIVFSYICDIGLAENSLDKAVNTIGMNYYDYLDVALNVINEDELEIDGKLTDTHTDQNDGTRTVEPAETVHEKYGFDGSGQWLVSDVATVRGGIVPGITNYTDSYTDMNGRVTKYINDAPPQDIINWRTRMHNSGFRSVNDYTLTNTFPIRYSMTGSLSLDIYDSTQVGKAVRNFKNIITFVSTRTTGDTGIVIKSNDSNATQYTVPFDGTEVNVSVRDTSGNIADIIVSVTKNEKGQEVLKLHFADRNFAVPENGGYVDLSLSGVNVTGDMLNTVYVNSSVLTPNKQPFSNTTQGSVIYDESGKAVSVTNNSSVNISFGSTTSSVKSVNEISNPTNKTDSNQGINFITLTGRESEFRYTLSVKNETNFAMNKLVIIDTLPEPNDTSPFDSTALRGSEFKVLLSDKPQFTVKIIRSDSNVKEEIDSGKYKIDFSTNTSFDSDDWKGISVWSDSPTGARAIRIVIDEGLIKNNDTVEISFNAKADGNVKAGQKAWNSFGYHYILDNSDKTELEAMPLMVGVQIPETPLIEKHLVNIEGDEYFAEQDTTFSFLIYKGEKLSGDYSTAEELINALEAKNIPYAKTDLTVGKNESSSSQKLLFEYQNLKWIDGEKYTIVELPTDNLYKLDTWNYISQDSVTFTYSSKNSITLRCQNIFKRWSIGLKKADGENHDIKLEGAGFAIYSPNQSDQISDEDYNNLEIKPNKTITDNDKVWYLTDISQPTKTASLNLKIFSETNIT